MLWVWPKKNKKKQLRVFSPLKVVSYFGSLFVFPFLSSLIDLFYHLYIYFFSTVQHGDSVTLTCIHSFFSHYVFHHKCLDRVPSATQQYFTANSSWRQHSASIYPKLPVCATPSPSLWQPQVYSPFHDFLFYGKVPLCHILYSRYKWYQKRHKHPHVHCSSIDNSQEMESTQMSTDRWLD